MSARALLVVCALGAAAGSARADVDAFGDDIDPKPWLGISYDSRNGILVTNVFEGSGAMACGLRAGDAIVTVDGVDVMPGTDLSNLIETRQPGDKLTIQVQRRNRLLVLRPVLTERVSEGERLHRQLVGKAMPGFVVVQADDKATEIDDSIFDGKVGVMVWYDQSCAGCAGLANRVAPWVERHRREVVGLVGVRAIDRVAAKTMLAHAPVLLPVGFDFDKGDADGAWLRYGVIMKKDERASVIVVDQQGVVRMVAALHADADDASLEGVFAAAERLLRTRKQPRR